MFFFGEEEEENEETEIVKTEAEEEQEKIAHLEGIISQVRKMGWNNFPDAVGFM